MSKRSDRAITMLDVVTPGALAMVKVPSYSEYKWRKLLRDLSKKFKKGEEYLTRKAAELQFRPRIREQRVVNALQKLNPRSKKHPPKVELFIKKLIYFILGPEAGPKRSRRCAYA